MAFKPRLTRPEAGNKYYITRSSGGYSNAIRGKPVDKDCDVLSNCVGYAVGRFHEIAGDTSFSLMDAVNAENIFDNAKKHGLQTGSTPKLGAMAVWQAGATLQGSDGAGHVAIVEKIDGDTITLSESGYGCQNPFWTTDRKPPYSNGDGFKLLGFVYQPDGNHNPYPKPSTFIKRGDTGDSVRWLQYELYKAGYLRENEIDGDYGRITYGAVLAYKFDNNIAGTVYTTDFERR